MRNRTPVTDKQQEVMDYIRWHISAREHPPTIAEIGVKIKTTSHGAKQIVNALEDKRLLYYGGCHEGITVL